MSWLWQRKLDHYPTGAKRYAYLVISVLATIILYYELYATGGVSTIISEKMHISFVFLVTMLAITNLIGAFGSLIAGVADRAGRSNLVVWGLLVVGLLTLIGIPACSSKWALAVMLSIVGLIEGMLLVATPALVRDFSPQVGRAAAMGIWNVGPVAGSLIVSTVATSTLVHFHNSWQSQFRIAGITGLVMFVVALIWMRELAPEIRDQLMVDSGDRELLEARAARGKVHANLDKPFSQLLHLDVVGGAIGFGTFLLLYFTLVGFAPVVWATVYGFSASKANGIGTWAWGANVVVTLTFGFLVDWTKVRKPWILFGIALTIVMEIILLVEFKGTPSYYELALITAIMSGAFGMAAVPFYAALTETIEGRNPALTATGLAIWGWIIRVIAFLSFIIIPHVVTAATTLLDAPPNPTTKQKASLAHAAAAASGQWQTWLWICVAGAVVFAITVPLMRGPWSKKTALEQIAAHDRAREEELAALTATPVAD